MWTTMPRCGSTAKCHAARAIRAPPRSKASTCQTASSWPRPSSPATSSRSRYSASTVPSRSHRRTSSSSARPRSSFISSTRQNRHSAGSLPRRVSNASLCLSTVLRTTDRRSHGGAGMEGTMRRIAGIEIVQAATFQRVSSGNLLLICGRLCIFALLLCTLAPSTGAQTVAGNSPPADFALTSYPRRTNPLDKITPVTDTLLAYVPDSDWLTWRRGHDAAGYSPLATINKDNARHLRSAWTWSLPNGPNEGVHDGVLFVHAFGDKVQALDAATGDLLWQY